jgi:hypothetical protein
MNLVGKILTVLIFGMSIIFMTAVVVVYVTSNNWRDDVLREQPEGGKPKGYKYRLADANDKNKALEKQLQTLEGELKREREAHIQTTTNLDELRKQWQEKVAKADAEAFRLKEEEAKKLATVNASIAAQEKMQIERDDHRSKIRAAQAERDASFARSTQLADNVEQVTTELKRVQARMEDLVQDADRMRDILRANGLNPNTNPATIIPNVKGIVVAMPEKGHMEVSLGSDDGLLPGHYLEVYRVGGGRNIYLGRVEVVSTAPDRAVCRIMPDYREGQMRTGDRVASKLE